MMARRSAPLSVVLALLLIAVLAAPGAATTIKPQRVRFNDLATVWMQSPGLLPKQTELVDLDGDGNGDLVVRAIGPSGHIIRTYRGDGQGYFEHVSEIDLGEDTEDMLVGTLDAQPGKDVAVLVATALPGTSGLRVYAGDGDCGLSSTPIDEEYGYALPKSLAEIGNHDLVIATGQGILIDLRNDGTGDFTAGPAHHQVIGAYYSDVSSGDIDSDGTLDIAALDWGHNRLRLYTVTATGFMPLGNPIEIGSGAWRVAVGDLDHRHGSDFAVLNRGDADVSVLLSKGSSVSDGWTRRDYPVNDPAPKDLCLFRSPADEPPHLAVVQPTGESIQVRLNDGAGGFGEPTEVPVGGVPEDVGAGFVSRDYKDDLVVADLDQQVRAVHVLENWFLPEVERLAGGTRYGTATEVAAEAKPHGTRHVVIATGQAFPDALAGVPLARLAQAPILLTRRDALPGEVAASIKSLGATHAYVLGGTSAVSAAVVEQLTSAAGIPAANITRIAGADRYETAYRIAVEMDRLYPSPITEAYIATGSNFPDALAGAIPAAATYAPILLTKKDSIPSWTQKALDELGIADTVVLGGTSVISQAVADDLPSSMRLGGATRYGTAKLIADYALAELGMSPIRIIVATGEKFPDALAAGLLGVPGGMPASPLLLVRGGAVPSETEKYVRAWGKHCSTVYVIGGTGAVSDTVIEQLETMY